MELLFDNKKQELEDKISDAIIAAEKLKGFKYFIKGDISGIQDFIFHVKSEKAAKVLKGRSFFIQALAQKAVDFLKKEAGNHIEVLYNGGGNFYCFANEPALEAIAKLKRLIDDECKEEEFYLTISQITLLPEYANHFNTAWREIHEKANKDKLKKFLNYPDAFQPFSVRERIEWEMVTKCLVRGSKTDFFIPILGNETNLRALLENHERLAPIGLPVWNKDLIDKYSSLIEKVQDDRIEKEPEYQARNNVIIEFEYFGLMAKERTGTDKLGVLKMDVDGLGTLFRNVKELKDGKILSSAFDWLMGDFMKCLLNEPFKYLPPSEPAHGQEKYQTVPFGENLYVVFSGGDDCFIVGAWDAIIGFAQKMQSEFTAFIQFMESKVETLKQNPVTISAGIVVVGTKYPVLRFAKLAEEAIKAAKTFEKNKDGQPIKNKVCIFNEVLTWEELKVAAEQAEKLAQLIRYRGEPRGILERIQLSAQGYERLWQEAHKKDLPFPHTSRLFYFLRNVKQEESKKVIEPIIKDFANALIEAYVDKKSAKRAQSMKYPVAARWAEFLTRK